MEIELTALIDYLPGHVYFYDLDCIIRACNLLQARALGFKTVNDAIGVSIAELRPSTEIDLIIKNNNIIIKTKKPHRFEEYVPDENGELKLFYSDKVPILKDDSVIGILGISTKVDPNEIELRKKDIIFQKVIDLIPAHIFWKDKSGAYQGCNFSQAIDAGFSKEEIIGKNDLELSWYPEAVDLMKNDKHVMSTGNMLSVEEFSTISSGQKRLYLSKKIPMYDDKGEIDGIIGVGIDITQEKEAEKLRIEAAEREAQHLREFQDLIDLLPAHIYWKDKNGLFLRVNLQQAQSLGFNCKEDVVGKGDKDVYPLATDIERIVANDQYVMSTKQLYTIEESGIMPDGQERVFLSKKIPTYDKNGEVDGIFGISIDITGEKELQKKERVFQEIIDMLPTHIYWKDKEGRYLGCNLKQAQSAGFTSSKELIGKTDSDPSVPWHSYHPTIQANDRQAMENKQLLTIEELATMNDGQERIFLSKKLPTYDVLNEVNGIVGVSVDITAEKEAERLIQESLHKQLHSANLISASIAHELRTPLMTINNNITALKINLPASNQFVLDKVQAVKKEINKANECINMLLMNIREIHLDKLEACSIQSCISEAIERFPYSNSQDIQLIVFNQDEQDFSFMGDRTLMVHVLFNLIKNAVYFIHRAEKGKIYISTAHDQHYNYLYFEDTACGIREANLNKIFERFYTTTDVGSGVGLSFCKLAIEKFGGSIDCSSVEGEFTKFTIRLPKL